MAVKGAVTLIKSGKVREGADALDAPLKSYQARFAGEKRAIYCAASLTQVVLYMTMAASAKRSAIAINPGWCEALFLKGYALIDIGKLDEGQRYLEQAVAMAPGNAHYLNELAFLHQQRRDWAKSIATYRSAAGAAQLEGDDASRKAEHGRALRGIGFGLVEQGKWEEAAEVYREALKIDPQDAKSTNELRWIVENRPKSS